MKNVNKILEIIKIVCTAVAAAVGSLLAAM